MRISIVPSNWRAALAFAVVALMALAAGGCASSDSEELAAAEAAQDAAGIASDAAETAAAAAETAAAAAQEAATAARETAQGNAAMSAPATAADGSDETLAAAQAANEAATQAAGAAQDAAQAARQAAGAAQEAARSAQSAPAPAANGDDGAAQDALAAAKDARDAAQEAVDAARDAAAAARRAATAAEEAVQASPAMMSGELMQADPGSLVIYSGRSESLVSPIIEQFRHASGIDVRVKYGGTSEIAATIQEEGANSPADVFWAQDPGALGALAPLFSPLPEYVAAAVPEWARHPERLWVGISGRARVVVYNTDLSEDELPQSLEELTDPKWKGRVGWPPNNASFRVMVTAMRQMWGEDKTREWLEGMLANDVKVFPKNTPIVAAAGAGEVDVGLVNHYYLHRFIAAEGDDFGARNLYLNDGGPGSLIMVAGAGALKTAANPDNAEKFVRFLLSAVAQQYFAATTFEYPLVAGVKTHHLLPPLDSLTSPDIDFAQLDDLEGSEALLRETGVIP